MLFMPRDFLYVHINIFETRGWPATFRKELATWFLFPYLKQGSYLFAKRSKLHFVYKSNLKAPGSYNSSFTSARRHDKTCLCTFQLYFSYVDTAKHLSAVSKEISEIFVTGELWDLTLRSFTDILWQGTVEQYLKRNTNDKRPLVRQLLPRFFHTDIPINLWELNYNKCLWFPSLLTQKLRHCCITRS